ncbi:MAG: TIGR02569 family protein [Micropruina sp.]|uniref:phosphotransferase n=1 Tax=Micropruina sp. TaxID=2737536 RepID=UPI0039E62FC6
MPVVPPTPPPGDVLRAFGASGHLVLLDGGRGLTWRAGGLVLRPTDDEQETVWTSEVLSTLAPNAEFTAPKPVATRDGAWVQGGWHAMEWLPGRADERRVDDVIRAGQAFHEAVSAVPRPEFLDQARDAWSVADRIAWGEHAPPADAFLQDLVSECREIEAPSQLIHGDLLGNVLFANGHPPTVIDWAPYWRPAGLGLAIAVVDAACWHELPFTALSDDHRVAQWREFLLRALAFRVATLHLFSGWDDEGLTRHAPIAEAIARLA